MAQPLNLTLSHLRDGYRSGRMTPQSVIEELFAAIEGVDERHVWITRLSRAQVMTYVAALDAAAIDRLPLYGIPFVIKDNIDLAGIPTTAACPEFAYIPQRSATVVERLIGAGAVPLGKTNLDQFATGLVGARSPYGACGNSFNGSFISGGSSAGSAVAVALGWASFALGTDTAGSGRVPAAFNNIVGLKPSNGRLSTRGVVPACRSLDCVSIFALTTEDAATVLAAGAAFDPDDVYSREVTDRPPAGLRFGVPRSGQLRFFGDSAYAALYEGAVAQLRALGGTAREIDFEPFLEAARLLYEGPWIAERFAAVGPFIDTHPAAVHPVTRGIIEGGKRPSAVAAFEGQYRLKALLRQMASAWRDMDFLLTPTTGTIYRHEELEAEPQRLNSNLGYYTNFMNLCDLVGVAVPAGFRPDGMPFGVTLVGPRGSELGLLGVASRLHRALVPTLGAMALAVPPAPACPSPTPAEGLDGHVALAVCGAHMDGLALNHQLRERGGRWVRTTTTAPCYRFFALPGEPPTRPGLLRVTDRGGAIELEIWALPTAQVGSFVSGIPAPLGLGSVELASGERVLGFLCESHATQGAADITHLGGWRAYLKTHPPVLSGDIEVDSAAAN